MSNTSMSSDDDRKNEIAIAFFCEVHRVCFILIYNIFFPFVFNKVFIYLQVNVEEFL